MTEITVTPEDEAATADLFEAMGDAMAARVIRAGVLRGQAHRNAAEFLAAHRVAAIAAERARGQKVALALQRLSLEARIFYTEIGLQTYGRKPDEMLETPQWLKLQMSEKMAREFRDSVESGCTKALAEWEAGK
jgi:hypothetical protein